jgi:hypothetical protein
MLVFFTFMPVGAAIGGLGGALLFGVVAARDDEIAVRRSQPARTTAETETQPHLCNAKLRIAFSPDPIT